jgi:galactokinase
VSELGCGGGFGGREATRKRQVFSHCVGRLTQLTQAPTDVWRSYFVPGRIEVLGKHTDYAGGSSLVIAAERGFCVLAAATADSQVTVTDAASGETIEFAMSPELTPKLGHWSNYPMTVARRLSRNFPGATRGAQIALASDLPPAAGLSSSSALMVGIFFALADANDLWQHRSFLPELNEPLNLAGYLATMENGQSYGPLVGDRGVGTFGGSEDHTAILCAQPGSIRQYAYCPVRFERQLPLPPAYTFAVASSGVVAEKTGAALEKYNRASRLAAAVAEIWRRETGGDEAHLAAVVRSRTDAAERLRAILAGGHCGEFTPRDLLTRFEHFLVENERVIPAAGAALDRGDLEAFGGWVDRSQHAAETLLGNQIPETVHLAGSARELGAVAASGFGAGFGGSVWALVAVDRVDDFLAAWQRNYAARFPAHRGQATFFATAAGPALCRLA